MRAICVVTGSRAEYGLLKPLMQGVAEDPELELQVAVTGMHLAPAFGLTYRDIEADGFRIDARVEMLLAGDTRTSLTKSVGLGVIGFADAFERLAPDIVVVLGDRFEIFAAAQAAYLQNRLVAHVHGGEVTEGALDDAIRHAITKLSSLHFVAADAFRDRVRQLGEAPETIHVVGAAANDTIKALSESQPPDLERDLEIPPGTSILLVTLHPETQSERDPAADAWALLTALEAYPDHQVVLTRPNADPGNRAIDEALTDWTTRHAHRARIYDALGAHRYLAVLKAADVVVGNSSSALIEAPALGTAAVNIGDRQKGRPRAEGVIDCPFDTEAIRSAIATALEPGFQEKARCGETPYGGPGAAERIRQVLKACDLGTARRKSFHDLPVGI